MRAPPIVSPLLALSVLAAACQRPGPQAAQATEGPSPTVAPPSPTAAPPSPTAAPALPAGWRGVGVLAERDTPAPDAPAWGRIVAEVVEEGGARLLRTSGHVQDIDAPALARTTAENRARAEMARWLNKSAVSGARVVDTWHAKSSANFLVQVAVPLPPDALAAR